MNKQGCPPYRKYLQRLIGPNNSSHLEPYFPSQNNDY